MAGHGRAVNVLQRLASDSQYLLNTYRTTTSHVLALSIVWSINGVSYGP